MAQLTYPLSHAKHLHILAVGPGGLVTFPDEDQVRDCRQTEGDLERLARLHRRSTAFALGSAWRRERAPPSPLHPFTPEAHGRRYGGPRDGLAASPKLDAERRSAPWTLQPGRGIKVATLSVRKPKGGPPMGIRRLQPTTALAFSTSSLSSATRG